MSLLTERSRLITRGPLWAITPEGFGGLMANLFQEMAEVTRFMALKPTTIGKPTHKLSVIPVQGVLTKDAPWAGTTYGSISDAVEDAAADPSVKRIVLAVDSPGGEVTGLPETAAVIARAAKVKPVSAHVDGTAASAAYWLASQSSDITLSPSSEVGSVGVRMMHADISKMMDDAGIKITELHAGKFKTEWTPFAPLSDDAKAHMQERLNNAHTDFIRAVAEGRGARASAGIRKARYGEGRMFTAQEAMGHGLADKVLSSREFYRAIQSTEELPASRTANLSTIRARIELEKIRGLFP
jgi:capsid assembly protease